MSTTEILEFLEFNKAQSELKPMEQENRQVSIVAESVFFSSILTFLKSKRFLKMVADPPFTLNKVNHHPYKLTKYLYMFQQAVIIKHTLPHMK